MPLTHVGNEVMKHLKKKHGAKKGAEVFYASINKGVAGSSKWHNTGKKEKKPRNKYSEGLMG